MPERRLPHWRRRLYVGDWSLHRPKSGRVGFLLASVHVAGVEDDKASARYMPALAVQLEDAPPGLDAPDDVELVRVGRERPGEPPVTNVPLDVF